MDGKKEYTSFQKWATKIHVGRSRTSSSENILQKPASPREFYDLLPSLH